VVCGFTLGFLRCQFFTHAAMELSAKTQLKAASLSSDSPPDGRRNTAAFLNIESCLASLTSSPRNGGRPRSPVRPQQGRQKPDPSADFLSLLLINEILASTVA
jgi:hypothetical protein